MNFQGHLLAASSYNGLLLQQGSGTAETAHMGGTDTGSGRQ
jgi:hypothetical protein